MKVSDRDSSTVSVSARRNSAGRLFRVALGMAVLASLGGCVRRTMSRHYELPAQQGEAVVRLAPGDVISVRFRGVPELDILDQTVRADGRISLVVVGDVEAAGLTPEELDTKLTALYKLAELVTPNLSVIVTLDISRRVYVGGEVYRPGPIPMPDELTVLEAVMGAGGFRMDSARRSKTIVIRQIGKERHARMVNLELTLKRPLSEPVYLAAGDVVYVPRTGIFKFRKWVEDHIFWILSPASSVARTATTGGI